MRISFLIDQSDCYFFMRILKIALCALFARTFCTFVTSNRISSPRICRITAGACLLSHRRGSAICFYGCRSAFIAAMNYRFIVAIYCNAAIFCLHRCRHCPPCPQPKSNPKNSNYRNLSQRPLGSFQPRLDQSLNPHIPVRLFLEKKVCWGVSRRPSAARRKSP